MQCKECRQLLSQFLDGQLDSQRQKKMQEHLTGCPDCSSALASITEMVNVMHSMQEAEPPADFLQKVNARIDSVPWWHDVLERLVGLWPQRLPMQAAAVLATLVLAVYISNQLKPAIPLRTEKNVSGQMRTAETSCPCAISQKAEMTAPTLKNELQVKEAVDELRSEYKFTGKDADYYHGGDFEKARPDKGARLRDNKEKRQLMLSGEVKSDGAVSKMPAPQQQQIPLEDTLKNKAASADVPVTPLSKAVVVELKEGNFIAANRQQKWTVSSAVRKVTEQEMLSVLKEMHVSGIEQEKISAAEGSGTLFRFTIALRQVSILLSRLEKMGEVTLVTPLPVVRPEAYTSARGGINPKVLEQLIPVELTLEKSR
ncbi:MAG: zf-HC2 domain-containing protein [Candidatus Omnitrophica bacterium]|nr:zf-HC2 domain-containing protein [Candidatus Omnitrophota bacterium]MBU4478672.1 zf-HC2 domain-containing protein [Candidatus Omnitrophota bacterium]